MFLARIFTLYPDLFPGPLSNGLYGKAMEKKIWNIETVNIRDYATDKHKTVDDTPYGGGFGMLIKPDILAKALDKKIKTEEKIYYLSPKGKLFDQSLAKELSKEKTINLICGHFEGVDEVWRRVCSGDLHAPHDAAAAEVNDHHTLCMTFEEMHAVVKTAHNHNMKVTGHCRATEGIKNALLAGYDSLEHGTFIDDETLELLLERDVPVVPALYFEQMSIERGPEFGMSQAVIDGHQETLDGGAESARRILEAGGRLGMGGDYGFAWNPHGDYAKELSFFVDFVGLKPLDVLKCATKTGAEIAGHEDEIGTLEIGKLADVLIVDGDVAADISLLQDRSRFIAVMQGGVVKCGQIAKAA